MRFDHLKSNNFSFSKNTMLPHNQSCGVPSNGVEVPKLTRLKADSELDSCFRFNGVEVIIVFEEFALR